MKNLFILILGILFLFFFSLVDAQISDLTSIENLQELTIDNTTYQVFSAYNDSVQGIYYQVKGDETTLNPVYNSGQNNSHPKIIGFDDKIYVVWQGWVEFPPASPGQNNSQPQYTIHYKYYENNEWSLSGIVYSGFSFDNQDANIKLNVEGNELQVTFYDFIEGAEKVETIAEIDGLTNAENIQELTINGTTYQVFSAYNDSVQGIYYQVKGDETTLNPVYNSGQNNSHPKIIGFDDKIYVVWQGWVEFPPASPGQNNSQPQYTIHYKYYENNEWSLSGIVYSGFAFNNEDADIQLGISENKLQVTYYDHVDGIEKVETIAEIYDEEVQSIKDTLTYNLILNGNIDKNKVISTLYFPSNLSGVKISWSSNDTTIISNKGIVTRDNFTDKDVLLFANLQKGETSDSKEFIVKVKKQVTATVPDGDGKIDAGSNTEVVIDNTNAGSLKQIEVPNTVADDEEVVLNLVTLVNSSKALTLGANNLTLSRNSNTGVSYSVEIPSGTIIQGESNWNGLITVPTVKSTSEVTVTGGTPDLVIEVGSTGVKLTFDKAVRLILPGKAGKSAGYVGTDDVFISIDDCTASEIADPNSLLAEGDCFTISEGDMVIWTKHFTKFVSYSSSSSSSSSSGSGPSGGKIRSNIVIAKEPIKEAIEIPVIEPVKEVPEVAAPTPIAQLTPVQEEQGFFDSLTGAVIGLSGKKSIAAIFVAAVTLVGVIGFYYRNIKRRERIRKQIESIKK